jgi:hypothetical protein
LTRASSTSVTRGVPALTYVGRLFEAESHHAQPAALSPPQVGPGIIGAEDCNPVLVQTGIDAALLAGYRFQRAHPGQMSTLRIGHHGDAGAGDARQIGDFTGVVHTHLDDRRAMASIQPEQGQWQTDVVVVVAPGEQHRLTEGGFQDAGDHLLGRRLAVAAGHGDHGQRETTAPVGGKRPQRQPRLGYLDQGKTKQVQANRSICGHHRGHRATRLGGRDVVVTIKVLATQGKKQLAGRNRTAIGRHATKA